jgi:hypothetical protein
MEEIMDRVLTRWELMRFTREYLRSLLEEIAATLVTLPEGSPDRRIALINLRDIERELTRRDMTSTVWRR